MLGPILLDAPGCIYEARIWPRFGNGLHVTVTRAFDKQLALFEHEELPDLPMLDIFDRRIKVIAYYSYE